MKTADSVLSDASNFAHKRGYNLAYYTGSIRQIARGMSGFMTSRNMPYDVADLDAVARGDIKTAEQIAADIRRARPKGTRMKLRHGC